MKGGLTDKMMGWVRNTQVWKAVFRHGYEDTDRNRSLITFTNVLYHLHPVKVRKEALKLRYTWCMGGTTFFLFVMLTITGVMLMFYYVPDTRRAYQDIKDIMQVVSYGDIMRNIHRWAAHGMVFTVWFHMTRVFLTGSYKPPREFNWVVGVILLVCTLLLSWTGYLLPWDQLALWAITVGTKMAAATPFIGVDGPFGKQLGIRVDNDVTFMLLGGTVVGQNALLRFYVLHCIVLPLIVTVFLAVHFWRIRKDGFSGPL
ncbi:MAG: cytochrome b N-terminal domain-containing protein [Nitrospirae bacterium]|nr:cytochrome b N-terminal domain-containing protein [Nitrospirota bacterium]